MSVIKLPAMPQPDGLMSDKNGDNADLVWSKEKLQSYARAAVEADRAQRVPDGWRLVPVEPTDAMVQNSLHLDLSYMPGHEGADRAAIYRAMLASTPAQPAQQELTPKECATPRACQYEGCRGNCHQEPPQPVERKPMTDPCPGCTKGHVCRTPKCGRLTLPVDHPLRCPTPGIRE